MRARPERGRAKDKPGERTGGQKAPASTERERKSSRKRERRVRRKGSGSQAGSESRGQDERERKPGGKRKLRAGRKGREGKQIICGCKGDRSSRESEPGLRKRTESEEMRSRKRKRKV